MRKPYLLVPREIIWGIGMKKYSRFFCVVIAVILLAGCDKNTVIDPSPTPSENVVSQSPVESAAPPSDHSDGTDGSDDANTDAETPPDIGDLIIPVPYDSDSYLSEEEFVVLNGIRIGMTYEQAAPFFDGYETIVFDSPTSKVVRTGGYFFSFNAIDETYGYYEGDKFVEGMLELNRDGTCYLLRVTMDESCTDTLIRDIRIGDSIEDVFGKLPIKDTKLRRWAYQNLYGKDEFGEPRAFLEYTTVLGTYRIYATTSKYILNINFDKQNNVKMVELIREDS